MAKIVWIDEHKEVSPAVGVLASTLADALADSAMLSKVYIETFGDYRYRCYFETNSLYFSFYEPKMNGTSDCYVSLNMYNKGSLVSQYERESISLDSFSKDIMEMRERGFPGIDGALPTIWNMYARMNNREGRLHTYLELDITCEEAILEILYALKEQDTTIVSSSNGTYELRFGDDKPIIKMTKVGTSTQAQVGFILYIENDGKTVWHKSYLDSHMRDFAADIHSCGSDGFDIDGTRWHWGTPVTVYETKKPPKPATKPVEEQERLNPALETPMRPLSGVVPHDIKSIRAVALKYEGKVIAFRFKTDKGTFDMSKEVAEKYGLSGLKTEKFIRLTSVNGLLMSDSEKQKNVFIPDVSENEVDCRRLIDAIFGR